MKPIVGEFKARKIDDKKPLDDMLGSGRYEKIDIATGEGKILGSTEFIEACKQGVGKNSSLRINILGKFEKGDLEQIKRNVNPLRDNLKVYAARNRPGIHFWLMKTKDGKTTLYIQSKHAEDSDAKEEFIVENAFLLNWICMVLFILNRGELIFPKV